MNVLVLGGSYFLGRYFVEAASLDVNITVFNRGNCPINKKEITQIRGDRHNLEDLQKLKDHHFDVVVDFCAYNKGDISLVMDVLSGGISQYIFISTVDVYKRGLNTLIDESFEFEDRIFPGEAGEYIAGKVNLEKEILDMAKKYSINYTVLRPAFIYGPGNYAPRESMYFTWIKQAGQILHPVDADGEFYMVYAGDVARVIKTMIGNNNCFNQAYNLTGDGVITYESFADALTEAVEIPFEKVKISLADVNNKGIPLPFPLTKEESNWYNGQKSLSLIDGYTSLVDGLRLCAKEYLDD